MMLSCNDLATKMADVCLQQSAAVHPKLPSLALNVDPASELCRLELPSPIQYTILTIL